MDTVVILRSLCALLLYFKPEVNTLQKLSYYLDFPKEEISKALNSLLADATVSIDLENKYTLKQSSKLERINTFAKILREEKRSSPLCFCLSRLTPNSSIDDCAQVLGYLDSQHIDQSKELILCLDLSLNYLQNYPVKAHESLQFVELVIFIQTLSLFLHSPLQKTVNLSEKAYLLSLKYGHQRLKPILVIIRCYQQVFISCQINQNELSFIEELQTLKKFKDQDMQNLIPYFEIMLYYIKGEYQCILKQYTIVSEIEDWRFRRLKDVLSYCVCRAAFCQRDFTTAFEIANSAINNKGVVGDTMQTYFWQLHLIFAFIRQGNYEEALSLADIMFLTISPQYNNKIYASIVRSIAIIHYLNGRISHSYHLLRSETIRMMELGVPFSPFEDSINLDMCFSYEEAGFPPIPNYEINELITKLIQSPNRILHCAANRISSLRNFELNPTEHIKRLQSTLKESRKIADVREETHCLLALAQLSAKINKKRDVESYLNQLKSITPLSLNTKNYQADSLLFQEKNQNLEQKSSQTTKECIQINTFMECLGQKFSSLSPDMPMDTLIHAIASCFNSSQVILFEKTKQNEYLDSCQRTSSLKNKFSKSFRWISAWNPKKNYYFAESDGLTIPIQMYDKGVWAIYVQTPSKPLEYLDQGKLDWQSISFALSTKLHAFLQGKKFYEESQNNQKNQKIITNGQHSHIIPLSKSICLQELLKQIHRASTSNAPILLLGETGVGKEVMASHIHQQSGNSGSFVTVHPASTPEHLFESEFFGHEKGAFTGAIQQKLGLLELANEGTLFIDEIGDIPLSIQTKLIRVLQDGSFRRVGGTRLIHSKFRLISATNKDLWQEIHKNTFREDLLYRIAVVPITIPPMRERKEDIIPMIQDFISFFAQNYHSSMLPLSDELKTTLTNYTWPGNIREIKNIIERAVILNDISVLNTVETLQTTLSTNSKSPNINDFFSEFPTLKELEEHYLRYVLKQTKGQVRGEQGAENILKIKTSTLYAKLKKHNIVIKDI